MHVHDILVHTYILIHTYWHGAYRHAIHQYSPRVTDLSISYIFNSYPYSSHSVLTVLWISCLGIVNNIVKVVACVITCIVGCIIACIIGCMFVFVAFAAFLSTHAPSSTLYLPWYRGIEGSSLGTKSLFASYFPMFCSYFRYFAPPLIVVLILPFILAPILTPLFRYRTLLPYTVAMRMVLPRYR